MRGLQAFAARAPTTRPEYERPQPTGQLSNSSRVITVCDGALAGRGLGQIDHHSWRDDSVIDEVPQGDQQLAGHRDDADPAHA